MSGSGQRGRPRDERRSDLLLRAALDLLAEQGYDLLALGDIAVRAGASKNTLYRRWPDKLALVTDACARFRLDVDAPAPSSDVLREELLAQAEAWRLDVRSGAIVAGLLSASARSPEVREPLQGLLAGRDRAIAARIEVVAEHLGMDLDDRLVAWAATVLQAIELRHWSASGVPLTRQQVEEAIDRLLMPMLGVDDPERLPAC